MQRVHVLGFDLGWLVAALEQASDRAGRIVPAFPLLPSAEKENPARLVHRGRGSFSLGRVYGVGASARTTFVLLIAAGLRTTVTGVVLTVRNRRVCAVCPG